ARRIATLAWLRETPVDHAVRLKIGSERHVEQSPLPTGIDVRKSRKRLADLPGGGNDAHTPGSLRNQKRAVWHGFDCPRVLQSARDDLHVELHIGGHAA